jgi:anaerobic magnesium-protoporphyrin IX monomethyl ester cyclase
MKITFVALGSEQLAISLLSAIAKRDGHKVGLAFSASLFHDRFNLEIPTLGKFFDDRHEVIAAIKAQKPDLIAFSVLTSTYQWSLSVAREAKELFPDVKTVFGGVHISAVPELVIAQPEVDYVIAGEGEVAFPEIIEHVFEGGEKPIPNTRYKLKNGKVIKGIQAGFIQDLDSLPHFDKELWEAHIRLGDMYLTMATRGCPFTCSFCFNNFFHKLPEERSGKYVRTRSVDHVLEELKIAKSRYNLKCVDFQDDVFTVSKPWMKEFLPRYKKEIGVPFQCLTHPRYMDAEIAGWLKEAGCDWVQMGVQSMHEDYKKSIQRYEKSDHVVRALEVMNKAGLSPKVDHMFGLPGEPAEAQEIARVVYAEQSPKRIQTFWTCYLPGTDMMKEGVADGSVSPEQEQRLNNGEDFYFFRNKENIKSPGLVAMYQAHEYLFRIFPIFPASIRKRLRPKHVSWVPAFIMRPIALTFDVIIGFRYGNPEFAAYANHYLFHLRRFFAVKLGFKAPKATTSHPNSLKGDLAVRQNSQQQELIESEVVAEA